MRQSSNFMFQVLLLYSIVSVLCCFSISIFHCVSGCRKWFAHSVKNCTVCSVSCSGLFTPLLETILVKLSFGNRWVYTQVRLFGLTVVIFSWIDCYSRSISQTNLQKLRWFSPLFALSSFISKWSAHSSLIFLVKDQES